jgi:diguanylate cyclase (GGDEF)-like protein
MRQLPRVTRFFQRLLASSKFKDDELRFFPLPIVHEIVYRLFSITTPFSLIPAFFVSWHKQQFLIMAAQGVLGIIVILHAFLLLKRNYRILSPFMMFSISIALYILAIVRGEHFVLYFGSAFTSAFYLLFERRSARYMNTAWTLLNCGLAAAVFPLEQAAYFLGNLVSTGIFIEVLFMILMRHEKYLERLAERDPLTNAYNRRKMMQDLDEAVSMQGRYHWPASIIIIDVDKFKTINDSFGHQEGDTVLKNLAIKANVRLRTTDRFYRYGGEEFVAFLTSTDIKQAAQVAASLCELIRNSTLSTKTPVTISCGVAEVRKGDTVNDWIERGDAALYRAKNGGRDRIEVEDASDKTVSIAN